MSKDVLYFRDGANERIKKLPGRDVPRHLAIIEVSISSLLSVSLAGRALLCFGGRIGLSLLLDIGDVAKNWPMTLHDVFDSLNYLENFYSFNEKCDNKAWTNF